MVIYSHAPASSSGNGQNDAMERIRRNEQKAQMENRIRIMKNDVVSKRRTEQDLERDIRGLEMNLHHIEEESTRIGGEYKRMTTTVQTTEQDSKRAAMGLREKDTELHNKEGEMTRLEHEISLLRTQITEKERVIVLVKQDIAKLMKEKEDFRRENELGHFTALSEEGHAHEKGLRLHMLEQDKKRKEAEIARKQQQAHEIHRAIIDKEQDIMQAEAELRQFTARM